MRPLLLLAVVSAVGCGRRAPTAPDGPVVDGLENFRTVSPRLFSGGTPDGPTGFAALKARGVNTVISVDGATPDVAGAEKYGLRYVHLPVGYDGIPRDRALQLARAVRDRTGPVYVHCHHGRHRGPAACAAIRLILDPTFTAADADRLMRDAGTDPKYTGLVGLPKTLTRPTAEELDRVPAEFPTVAAVPDLTKRMVAIDEVWDRLRLVKAAGWAVPKGRADLDPPHEAVQLGEHYRESARLPAAAGMPFADAATAATELEAALRSKDAARADAAFARAAKGCSACHTAHRDTANK